MVKAFSPHGSTLAVVCIQTQNKLMNTHVLMCVQQAGKIEVDVKDVCVLFLCMYAGTRKCMRTGYDR